MSKGKRVLLFTFLFLILCASTARPLFLRIVQWQVQSFCLEYWGQELEYSQLEWEGKKIVFHDLHLAEEGKSFTAKRMEFSLHLDRNTKRPKVYFSLDTPFLSLERPIHSVEPLVRLFHLRSRFLPEVVPTVHQGTLRWLVGKEYKEIQVNLEEPSEEQVQRMEVSFPGSGRKDAPVTLHRIYGKEKNSFHVHLNDVDCSFISWLDSLIEDPWRYGWQIRGGKVNGNLEWTGDERGTALLQGRFHISQLVLYDPLLKMQAGVDDAALTLDYTLLERIPFQKNHLDTTIDSFLRAMKGHLHIRKGAYLALDTPMRDPWKIRNFVGEARLEEGSLQLALNGILSRYKERSYVNLTGDVSLLKHASKPFDIALEFVGEEERESLIHLLLEKEQQELTLTGDLQGIDQTHIAVVQDFLRGSFPEVESASFQQGLLDAHFYAILEGEEWKHVTVENAVVKKGVFSLPQYDISGSFEQIYGKMNLQKQKDIWLLDRAHVTLEEGDLYGKDGYGKERSFHHVNSTTDIHHGSVTTSETYMIDGQGCDIQVALWGQEKKQARFSLYGKVGQALTWIPEAMHSSFPSELKEEEAGFSLWIEPKKEGGLSFTGDLVLESTQHASSLTLKVEGLLESVYNTLWRKTFQKRWGDPFWRKDTSRYDGERLCKALWKGYQLNYGKFSALRADLKTYLTPFSRKKGWTFLGNADLTGYFDGQRGFIHYKANDVSIETPAFTVHSPFVTGRENTTACLYWNIPQKLYGGTLFSQGVQYREKRSGLVFEDTHGDLYFTPKRVSLDNVGTTCSEMALEGRIRVQRLQPHHSTIELYPDSIQGSFSSVQNFLEHIQPRILAEIPLQGFVETTERASIYLSAFRGKVVPRIALKGKLSHGSLLTSPLVSVCDLEIPFSFDSRESALLLYEGRGLVEVNGEAWKKNYTLSLPQAVFYGQNQEASSFQLQLLEEGTSVIQLVGQVTRPDTETFAFTFDEEQSHIYSVHPKLECLQIRNDSELLALKGSAAFDASLVAPYFDLFPKKWFARRRMPHRGELQLSFAYDGELELNIKGEEVTFLGHPLENVTLSLTKKEDLWKVEQLDLGSFSGKGTFTFAPEAVHILSASASWGDHAVLEGQGALSLSKKSVEGELSSFAFDFDPLRLHPLWGDFFVEQSLGGAASGEAWIHFSWGEQAHQGRVSFSSDTLHWKEYSFQELYVPSLEWESQKKWALSDVRGTWGHFAEDFLHIPFTISKITYEQDVEEWKIVEASVQAPSPQLAKGMSHLLPSSPYWHAMLAALKKDLLHIDFSAQLSPQQWQCDIECPSGEYTLFGSTQYVESLKGSCSNTGAHLALTYGEDLSFAQAVFETAPSSWSAGTLTLMEPEHREPLCIEWSWEEEGVFLNSLLGSFLGMDVSMTRQEGTSTLEGTVFFDGRQVASLLPEGFSRALQRLSVGKGYCMSGAWEYDPKKLKEVRFSGTVTGKNCEFMNYFFQEFSTEVEIRPGQVLFQNLNLNDLAGLLRIDWMSFDRGPDGRWIFSIPYVTLSEFRPSLMRTEREELANPTPLLIEQLNIHSLQGFLEEEKSYRGQGYAQFIDRSKKERKKSIFAIPSDLMTRIGLDFDVMSPVSGTVYFDIYQGKVIFTRLADLYSQGKASKFYLSSDHAISTMDFEGNLDMRVRMKQFNLIFKFAEIFTITVKGSIKSPEFTILQQFPKEKKERFERKMASR